MNVPRQPDDARERRGSSVRRTRRAVLRRGAAAWLAFVGRPGKPAGVAANGPTANEPAESNKDIVRRYYALVNANRLAALGEVLSPDFVIRTAPPDEDDGVAGLTANLAAAHAGLPDFELVVDDLLAEGDLVAVRTTIRGTHEGVFFGAPPTGRTIETTANDLWRVADGHLVEVWHVEDILGVMQQLGAAPDDGGTAAVAGLGSPSAGRDEAGAAARIEPDPVEAKETAYAFLADVFGRGEPGAVEGVLTPGFVWHWHSRADPGPGGPAAYAARLRAAFPDLQAEPQLAVAEADRVAVLWTLTGTQEGCLLGLPPSGRRVATPVIDIFRFDDGRIAELWSVRDDVGMLAQLGAFGPPSGAAVASPGA